MLCGHALRAIKVTRMRPAAHGRMHCWEGGSLWLGEAGGNARFHAHHALQISLAFSGSTRFRTRSQNWRPFTAAFVPSHLPHAFEAETAFTAQVFVEPETPEGRALLARFGSEAITELPAGEVGLHVQGLRALDLSTATAADLQHTARRFVDGLAGAHRSAVVDARIGRVIRALWRSDRSELTRGSTGAA